MVKPCVPRRKQSRITKSDSAVAEVLGTILIFAIAISLFTTFVLWYVPATGTVNEQHYDQLTQNAFYKFSNDLADSNAAQGQSVSYSFPTGISGIPPFSPSTPTSVSFSRNFDNFSVSLYYSLTLSYSNSTGAVHYYNTTQHYIGKGVFKSAAQTQFTTPTSYDLQDGFLIQEQGRSNPATAIGPLPVSMATPSPGTISMGSSIYNVSGPSETSSSVGSSMVTLYYNSVNSTKYSLGQLASINGTIGKVDTITLNSFFYNVTSTSIAQWNLAFYKQFNSTGATLQQSQLQKNWNFTGFPFDVTFAGSSISITNRNSVSLHSTDFSAYSINVNSV